MTRDARRKFVLPVPLALYASVRTWGLGIVVKPQLKSWALFTLFAKTLGFATLLYLVGQVFLKVL